MHAPARRPLAEKGLSVMSRSASPLADPRRYVYWTDDRLRFGDLDSLGHANNNAFGVFFESGRVALFEDVLGGPLGTLTELSVVIARISIDFLAELHYPAPHLRIGTRISRFGRTSVDIEAALFKGDPAAGLCVATSQSVCVLFDPRTRRPAPVPASLQHAIERLAGPAELPASLAATASA